MLSDSLDLTVVSTSSFKLILHFYLLPDLLVLVQVCDGTLDNDKPDIAWFQFVFQLNIAGTQLT